MNFSEANSVHGGLPQFAELTPKSGASRNELNSGIQQAHIISTNAPTTINHGKQPIAVSQQNKYPGGIVGWPDTLMQLSEKQASQSINIPSYNNQNNAALLGVQSGGLRIIPNMYLPSTSQNLSLPASSIINSGSSMASQMQSAAMAEYLQKLQATSLPMTLQQLMKLQSDPGQKMREKSESDDMTVKTEGSTNSILNIPSVPVFRNGQTSQQNGNYMHAENMMMEINPSDLNVHMESNDSANGAASSENQTEKSERTGGPGEANKTERKMKFRAKTGEIKIALGLDGSMLYCCPECSLAFSDKADIEQHIQGHVQERKYQCKECGAMLKRKEHLDQHMRGHSDERPFKCPVCQKAFKRNEHLTRHYVIHSGDKNFTCNVCTKAFSRKDHLNKHAQTHLGVKRAKSVKKESSTSMDQNVKDEPTSSGHLSNSDDNPIVKQDINFLQHIHHLQKDQNFIQTFSAFKEQAIRDAGHGGGSVVGNNGQLMQQQAVNMNEILPQNARYLMPSQLQS